ncbi:MAG: tagaturonate reductase [Ginsengibacter sp.]
MKLSLYTLKNIPGHLVTLPNTGICDLPEKVLQFGTGRLLRGLPDYFIDKANREGIFNGRIVIVKSTSKGDCLAFEKQDCLYTICERGIQKGEKIENNIVSSAISRVLNANNEWERVLKCAHNEHLNVIISNTTEVGIRQINESVHRYPPVSFPGKLLSFLYERFIAFNGSRERGLVIVPTELIPDNGKKLEAIIFELAYLNGLEDEFMEWLEESNYFCNSLVDRIVTGMPDEETRIAIEDQLEYKDDLLTVTEIYRLWAIEGNDHVKKILSFCNADEGVIIENNIELHRELKLRLLNGTHTFFCGAAFLSGYKTVRDSVESDLMSTLIIDLMNNEISPSIPCKIDDSIKQLFISKVLDRFRNPHISHYWRNITFNYTSKIKTRCIPLLINYYKTYNSVPKLFAFGISAYLFFMKATKQINNEFFGESSNGYYLIDDEMAEFYYNLWQSKTPSTIAREVFENVNLWDADLILLPGFINAVTEYLILMCENGMAHTMENVLSREVVDKKVIKG